MTQTHDLTNYFWKQDNTLFTFSPKLAALVLWGILSTCVYAQPDVRADYYSILARYGAGDTTAAYLDLQDFIRTHPRSTAHAYVQLIQWASFHQRLDEAEVLLTGIYETQDATAGALGLAHLRLRQKRPADALLFAKEATAWQSPWYTEDEHPYGVVAMAYRDLRTPQAGFAYFDSLRSIYPGQALATEIASLSLAISTGQPERLAQHADVLASYADTVRTEMAEWNFMAQTDAATLQSAPQIPVYWHFVGLARYYTGDRAGAYEAFSRYREALEASDAVHGIAAAAIGAGSAIVWTEGVDAALPLFEEGYTWAKQLGDHRRTMIAMNSLAAMQAEQGAIEAAIPRFEALIPLAQRTENAVVAYAATVNLARLYRVIGRPAHADAMVYRGVELAPTTKAPQHQVYALVQLAEMERDHGNYTASIEAYEQLLDVARTTGVAHDETRALVQLSELYTFLADPTRAAVYAEQAIDVAAEQTYPYPHFIAARAKAGLLLQQGHADQAAALYEQALLQIGPQSNSQYQCDIELGLGYARYRQGQTAAAVHHFQSGIRIADAITYAAGQVGHRVRLARVYREAKRFAEAKRLLSEALSRTTATQRSDLAWLVWSEEAQLARAQERKLEALAAYQHALNAFEHSRAGVPEELRAGFVEDYRSLYTEAALLAHDVAPVEAFHIAERARARHLLDITGRVRAERLLPDSLQRRVYAFSRQLDDLRAKLGQALPDTAVIRLQAERDHLQAEQNQFFANVAADHPQMSQQLYPPVHTAEDVQENLQADEALLSYLVGADRTLAFGVTQDTLVSVVLPFGRTTLQERVHRLLPWLTDTANRAYDLNVGYAFYAEVLAPLLAELRPQQRLTIIPDDVLFYVPFEILPVTAPAGTHRYATARYALHNWTLRYSPSASMLETSTGHPEATQPLLALGNPLLAEDKPIRLAALPGTEAETSRARAHLSGQRLTAAQATESAWREAAPHHRVLHLATHAVLDDQQPMYSRIVLTAPPTIHETENDGALQSYELYTQRLSAQLAVLSACNTAQGRLQQGEGLIGLVRGFQQAGVPSVVASLWPVNDAATTDLMDRFYAQLAAGQSADTALRTAKLEWLASANDLRANPFYWASFLAIGPSDLHLPPSRPSFILWLAFAVSVLSLGYYWGKRRKSILAYVATPKEVV